MSAGVTFPVDIVSHLLNLGSQSVFPTQGWARPMPNKEPHLLHERLREGMDKRVGDPWRLLDCKLCKDAIDGLYVAASLARSKHNHTSCHAIRQDLQQLLHNDVFRL